MTAPRPPDGQCEISASDAVRTGGRMNRPVLLGERLEQHRPERFNLLVRVIAARGGLNDDAFLCRNTRRLAILHSLLLIPDHRLLVNGRDRRAGSGDVCDDVEYLRHRIPVRVQSHVSQMPLCILPNGQAVGTRIFEVLFKRRF